MDDNSVSNVGHNDYFLSARILIEAARKSHVNHVDLCKLRNLLRISTILIYLLSHAAWPLEGNAQLRIFLAMMLFEQEFIALRQNKIQFARLMHEN
jgi:hypothetical protein